MSGATSPLLHMPSWHAQGQLNTLLDLGPHRFVVIWEVGGGRWRHLKFNLTLEVCTIMGSCVMNAAFRECVIDSYCNSVVRKCCLKRDRLEIQRVCDGNIMRYVYFSVFITFCMFLLIIFELDRFVHNKFLLCVENHSNINIVEGTFLLDYVLFWNTVLVQSYAKRY
jgi:hypothetical protein